MGMITFRVCAKYNREGSRSAESDVVRVPFHGQLSVPDSLTIRQVYDQVEDILRGEYPDFRSLVGIELNRNY